MDPFTQKLWLTQDQHVGDRQRLFEAIATEVEATSILYPGSYIDIAPSFVFDAVTYVDTDDRAARFFGDVSGVQELIGEHRTARDSCDVTFHHRDYREDLDLEAESFDLLVSLYAGFVSEHCTGHLRVGGTLLVNSSHGDAAMASIDTRYRLRGVVTSRDGRYGVSTRQLDSYLVTKKEQQITVESLHQSGRGIAYTKSPFAYLFERIA